MKDIIILRLEAPLMSFGGNAVDNLRVSREHPCRSMLTGLLANAMGWTHGEADKLASLQDRLDYAVVQLEAGVHLVDFHTVDLGQEHLHGSGWTSRGCSLGRGGGPSSSKGTHIMYKHYRADAAYMVGLSLRNTSAQPDIFALAEALQNPARPLFLGRKTCIPSSPLYLRTLTSVSCVEALIIAISEDAVSQRRTLRSSYVGKKVKAWWSASDVPFAYSREFPICEDRDWRNQIHVGRRFVREGHILIPEVAHDDGK